MKHKTDVIVVGGGPAGISAAVTIARAGKNVILIERGNFSGSKNVFGGAIYTQPTKEIFVDFENSAPLERKIISHKYVLSLHDDVTSLTYLSRDKDSSCGYTVIRSKFDRWMAQQAEKEGVVLVCETLVNDLIIKENKIIGVKTELEEYFSDIVIVADGVNSLLAKKAGLRNEIKPKDVALGVKEVIKLDKAKIEERFNLNEDEGCVFEFLGEPMLKMLGLGYLYTNKDTISIGIGIGLDELVKYKLKPYELLDKLKENPNLKPYIKDGELVEYCAHLIPEGGYNKIPKLYSNGIMLVGDSAMLVNNLHWEGTNLAMISGKLAGETAIVALDKKDFSANMLSLYQKKIEKSFVMKDLKTYKNLMSIAHSRANSYLEYYPKKVIEFFKMFTSVDGVEKHKKYIDFIKGIFTDRSLSELFKDLIGFIRIFLGVLK